MSESNDLSCFEMYYRNINLGKYVWLNSGMLPGAEVPDLCRACVCAVPGDWELQGPASVLDKGKMDIPGVV